MRWRVLEQRTEQAFELTSRDADRFRQCIGRKRLFHLLFYHVDHLNQLAIMDAVARRDLHALMIAPLPDAFDDELFRHLRREFRAMLARDEIRHQIDGRRAARAGDAAGIDFE